MPQNSVGRFQTFIRRFTTTLIFKNEIQIPKKIERGPTDILKALSSTIKRDPTAAHYKFIDDPYLIPNSLGKKRMYALSKEAGKRAAMWILQEHAEYLDSKMSDPLIESFVPDEKLDKTNVTEEKLLKLIKLNRMKEALEAYELLGDNISKDAKQNLLEMLCFYNSVPPISEKFIEERSFQRRLEPNKNMWNANIEIEKLFGELKSDPETAPKAYNTLICGMAKYLKVDKAWQLYEECEKNNIPLNLTTYNHLLQISSMIRDNNEERKNVLLTLMGSMNKNNIKPNVLTLNACLKTAASFSYFSLAKDLALSLYAEFTRVGVKPSLASYYYLLKIFYVDDSGGNAMIMEILEDLEKTDIEIQDLQDCSFFVYAMEVASRILHDITVGDRIHRLLSAKENYRFIGGRLNESIYYRFYLLLLSSNETFEDFMKIYYDLVPHVHIPEPSVMKDIVHLLELNDKEVVKQHIPRLLSDIVTFDMLDRRYIMTPLFKVLTMHCVPEKGSDLEKQYTEFALALWNHCHTQFSARIQRVIWPASVFGDLLLILMKGEQFDKMSEIMKFMVGEQTSFVGNIPVHVLNDLLKTCLVKGLVTLALDIVDYSYSYGITEGPKMLQKVTDVLPLSEREEKRLSQIQKSVTSRS